MNTPLTTMKLAELDPHACGEIVDIDAPDHEKQRLMSMGVCPGRTVELVMRGDPMILRVFGTRIGLSRRLGDCIWISPCHEHDDDEPESLVIPEPANADTPAARS